MKPLKNKRNRTRLEYIQELRKKLLIVIIPCLVIFLFTFFQYQNILNWLLAYYNISAINITPTESLNTGINFATLVTMIFFIPSILYQLFSFSKEMVPRELHKEIIVKGIFGVLLAMIGLLFGVTIFTKTILQGLDSYTVGQQLWSLSSIFQTAILFAGSMGLSLQMIWFLPLTSKAGLTNKNMLKKIRPYAFVGIMIISAFLTPPDAFSMAMMILPIYGSYEVGTLLTKSNKEVKVC